MYNQDIASVCERYKKLYVPAVVDTLDRKGLWNQILSSEIMPLTDETKIVGPAFTMFGQSTRMTDKTRRLAPKALAEVVPYSICVMATSDDRQTGHWGELMTVAAKFKGCTGAVVDGGIRDTDRILREKFPIFYKFRCPGDALGRFNIVDYQCPVEIGGVRVYPGDFVFGDIDGVVIIPKGIVAEVLEEAERVVEVENEIRERLLRGESIADLYLQYEQF